MTTTPTPSPEAEALPTLPVVAWRRRYLRPTGVWTHLIANSPEAPLLNPELGLQETEALTPLAPAEAAIVALRDDRDSWCQQASARAEDAVRFAAERDALRAEVAELRKDAERYRWLRSLTVGYRDENNAKRFRLPNIESGADIMRGSVAQHLDAAIDAARASLLGDGGTL